MQEQLPLRPGDVVAGRLRVTREMARGGMGVLFEAQDETLGRSVAVKVLLPELASSPELVARLLREGRAAARLTSRHAARVYEVGLLEGGLPYLVLELLEGESIEDVLVRKGALDIEEALDWTVQALDAVAEAHAAGLVHRDLKPSNVFVARTPTGLVAKVLDFGIARDAADDARLTRTGDAVGTPAYMAPEQIFRSREVDARADIWSIGASLYEMLSGRLPYEGSVVEMVNRIATTDAPPLLQWRAEVGERLSGIVARCLSRAPEQRWPDARSLRGALEEELAARRAARPAAPRGDAATAALAATEPLTPYEPEDRPPRSAPRSASSRRTSNLRIGGAALLATLAAGAGIVGTALMLRAKGADADARAADARAADARAADARATDARATDARAADARAADAASLAAPAPKAATSDAANALDAAPPARLPAPAPAATVHCQCFTEREPTTPLCARFERPYDCVLGPIRLCNPSPELRPGCTFLFQSKSSPCYGYEKGRPETKLFEGRPVPVGCVNDYGPGRDGQACVGQYRPVDSKFTGTLRCR